MAADLVANPHITQTMEHDLESFYWVLLWICLLYMDNGLTLGKCSSVIKSVMNPKAYAGSSGNGKIHFMVNQTALCDMKMPHNEMFVQLLNSLHVGLGTHYREQLPKSALLPSEISPAPDRTQSKVEHASEHMTSSVTQSTSTCTEQRANYEMVLKMLNTVLTQNTWPSHNRANPQDLAVSEDELFAYSSGTKRSRSVAKQGGAFGPSPAAKWLEVP
jgi:hypothetical protein